MSKAKHQTRIALFGGTFDPVHEGHLLVARHAVEALSLDQVIFLPCRQSPHKAEAAGAGEGERLEMLKLATQNLPWARVSSWEYEQPIPSYSWKTAEFFAKECPDAELFWLMGADQWAVISTWDRADYLASLVSFIVHDRDAKQIAEAGGATFVSGDHPAAASLIRNQLVDGGEVPAGWLAAEVGEFIARKGLYRE